MSFNADQFTAAHQPWTFARDGETFTACEPSADEVVAYRGMVLAAGDDVVRQRAAIRWLLAVMFPPRARYIWTGHPAKKFLAMPWAAQEAALTDFFARRRLTPPPRQKQAPGSGSGSRTGTPTKLQGAHSH